MPGAKRREMQGSWSIIIRLSQLIKGKINEVRPTNFSSNTLSRSKKRSFIDSSIV